MSINGNSNNNNVFKTPKKPDKNTNFALRWSITTIVICSLISLLMLVAADASWIPGLSGIKQKISNLMGGVKLTPGLSLLGGRQNVLLLGVDSNGSETDPFKGTRSDTIMVFSVDPITKSVNVISIPRDSKVYIAEHHGVDKINSAHAFGGPELTIKTIERTFGIKINHYVEIDYQGVRDLVDSLGGVSVNVEKRMRYTDHSAGLKVDLYPGYQTLNGKQAEEYLRFRHDAIGDIGRTQRQQWFVRAIINKFQSPDIIIKIPQLIQLASKYIRTDMNFYELSQFAAFAKSVNLNDVQSATLPGKPSNFGIVSYWILDTQKVQDIVDRLIYRDELATKDKGLSVSILYSSDFAGKIPEIKTNLEKEGFLVTCDTKTRIPHSQILSHSNDATVKNAEILRQQIPELKKAQFIVSPDNYLCGKTDYTLVLSNQQN